MLLLSAFETMPPKSAKKRQRELILEKARDKKRRRESGEGTSRSAKIEVRTERSGTDDEPGGFSRRLGQHSTLMMKQWILRLI